MAGGYGRGDQGNLASRTGADRPVDPPSPARHCFVDGQPSLLVEWRRGTNVWEGRVISVVWVDAVGWATVERWLLADEITRDRPKNDQFAGSATGPGRGTTGHIAN